MLVNELQSVPLRKKRRRKKPREMPLLAESSITSETRINITSPTGQVTPVHALGNTPSHANGRTPTHANGHTPTHANGRTPTHANGYTPTHANGYTPTHANGYTPTHANGRTPTHANGTNGHTYAPGLTPLPPISTRNLCQSLTSLDLRTDDDDAFNMAQYDTPTAMRGAHGMSVMVPATPASALSAVAEAVGGGKQGHVEDRAHVMMRRDGMA